MEFDGDGIPDILSGCYSEHQPMAGLLWLLPGAGDGTVKKAVALKGTDNKPLIIPADESDVIRRICTQPAAHDWDGDGDLDILTGNFEGTYFLFINEGSKDKAAFNPGPAQILSDGKPLRLQGLHSGVCPVDWDGDGDADILTGSAKGGAWWAENRSGGKGVPEFGEFRELLPAHSGSRVPTSPGAKASLPGAPGEDTRVWAADVNGDGKQDLLIGDAVTLTSKAAGLTDEEFASRQSAWDRESGEMQNQLAGATTDEARREASAKWSEHYRKRAAFIKEERTGFVWLMLRK